MKLPTLSPLLLLTALGTVWGRLEAPGWECLSRSSSGSSDDCAQALRKFPAGLAPGKFHIGGFADEYQLPQTFSKGSCEVTITTIHPAFPVTASWLDVFNLGNSLMVNCGASDGWKPPLVKVPFYKWYSGGSVRYGDAATGLKMNMKKSPSLMENATLVEDDGTAEVSTS